MLIMVIKIVLKKSICIRSMNKYKKEKYSKIKETHSINLFLMYVQYV